VAADKESMVKTPVLSGSRKPLSDDVNVPPPFHDTWKAPYLCKRQSTYA
jgi:hypothetical protein